MEGEAMTVTTVSASFGQRVRFARKGYGMSLEQLAGRSGIAKSTLWSIERETAEPRLDTAVAIADVLQLTVDYLVNGNNLDHVKWHVFLTTFARAPEDIQRKTRKIFAILNEDES